MEGDMETRRKQTYVPLQCVGDGDSTRMDAPWTDAAEDAGPAGSLMPNSAVEVEREVVSARVPGRKVVLLHPCRIHCMNTMYKNSHSTKFTKRK